MEVFHEMGVADDVYAPSPADDRWRKVVWFTSIAAPRRSACAAATSVRIPDERRKVEHHGRAEPMNAPHEAAEPRGGPVNPAEPLLVRLRALDTCAVSDALDTLGLAGATTGLMPLWAVPGPVAGRVRTVLAGPPKSRGPTEHIATAAIEAAEPGDVLVIANNGRVDVSCWGGILTLAAARRGIGAVVVDGAMRDIAECDEQDFPVFGRAVVPVSARGRIVQLAMGGPVEVAGVIVEQGDYVLADRNGVVFVPAGDIERVLGLAERVVAREAGMAEAVRAGLPVTEVMHDSRFPTVEETTS